MTKFGFTISKGRVIDYDANDKRIADYIYEREPSFRLCIECGGCSATCTTGNLIPFSLREFHILIKRGEVEKSTSEYKKMHALRKMYTRMSPWCQYEKYCGSGKTGIPKTRLLCNLILLLIPFNIGLYFILIYVVVRSVIWFRDLSRADKLRLQRGFFGVRIRAEPEGDLSGKPYSQENTENKHKAGIHAHEPCFWLVFAYPLRYN